MPVFPKGAKVCNESLYPTSSLQYIKHCNNTVSIITPLLCKHRNISLQTLHDTGVLQIITHNNIVGYKDLLLTLTRNILRLGMVCPQILQSI